MKKLNFLLLLSASVGFIAANGQNKSNDTTAKYFIIQVSIGNLQEISMGRLAVSQAVNPEVKAFAARIVADHSKAQAQLMQLMKSKPYQIPHEATDSPVQDLMLKNTPAKDFDQMYVHMMVPNHRETVHLFEDYALTGKDPDVRSFAQQTLPVLKQHLEAITAIDQSLMNKAMK